MNDNDKKKTTVNKPQRNYFDEDMTLHSISDYRKLPQRRKRLLNRSNSYDDDENCVTDRLLKVDTKDQDMFYDADENGKLGQNDDGGKISGTITTSALHEKVALPDSLVILSDPNHSDDDNDENSQQSISSSRISISSSSSNNDNTNIAFDDLSDLEQDIVLHETTIESLYSKFAIIQQNIQSEKVKIEKYKTNIQSLNQQHHQLRLLRNTNIALMKSVTFTFQKCLQRLRKKLNQKNVSDSNSASVNNKSALSDDQIDSCENSIDAPMNVFESTIDTSNESSKDSDLLLKELLSAPVGFTSHVVNQAIPADSISSCDKGNEFVLRDDQLDSSYSFIGVPIDVSESTVEPTNHYGEDSISLLNQLLATPVELTSHIVNPIMSIDSTSSCDKNMLQDSNRKKLSSSILLKYLQSQCFPRECRIYNHSEHIPNPIHPLHSSISNGNFLNQMMTLTQKEITDTYIQKLESKNHESPYNDDMYYRVVWDEIHGTCIDFITSCSYDPHILEILEDEKMNKAIIHEKQDKDGYDTIHDKSECSQINLDGHNYFHNDLHNTLCPNDLIDGICTDSSCRFQHFPFASNKFSLKKRRRGIKPKKKRFDKKNMNFAPPLQLPKLKLPENIFLQFPSVDEKCCKRTRYQDKDIQVIKDVKDGLGNMNVDETIIENHTQVQNIPRSCDTFSECDFIEVPHLRCKESSSSGETQKDEINQIEFQNNHKPFESSFLSRLSMYGFTILPSSNHGDKERTFSIHYNKNESSSHGAQMYPFTSQQEKEDANRILSFEIAIIKAIKFSLFAGRFDISLSLLSWGRSICLDLKRSSSRNQHSNNIAHHNHFIIILKVLLDVSRIVTGSLCGRGSLCVHGIYFSQIYLATLEVFLLAYSDTLNACSESSQTTAYGSNHISTNNNFFRACNELFCRYESFRNVSFGLETQNTQKVDSMIQEESDIFLRFPDHLLTLEVFYHDDGLLNFTMNHFNAVETGKKLARYVANIVRENRNINPQLIVESFLSPITIRMQQYLNKFSLHESMNLTHGRTSSSGISSSYHCQLYLHAMFSPMVFTCFASIILLMRSQHHSREYLSHHASIECLQKTRNHGIILSAKNILIDIIQILDFSRFRINSEDGMMLLTPFHSLLVTVYVSIGYFSEAQKHIERLFFTTANNEKSNMAIFSELLWSQLIQLRMSFPTQNENISNLANRPFNYDLHLNKLSLRGDSALSRCALHHLDVVFYNEQSFSSTSRCSHQDEIILNSKQSIELSHIREACYKLSLSDSLLSQQEEEQGMNGISISRRHITKFTDSIPYFPRSILLKGWNFKFLYFDSCGLNELPESIGDHLPNLTILDISHNNLRIIPSSVSRMSQLTKLKISFNQITTLPTSLSTLSQLEILLARKNLIYDVSFLVKNASLGGCLSTLDLRENKVDQTSLMMLPLKLSKLSKLLT